MFFSLTLVTAVLTGIFSVQIAQRLFFPYFWKDLFFFLKVIRWGLRLELYKKTKIVTVIDRFVQQAQRIPDKAFLIYEGCTYTYREIDERSNRVARALKCHSPVKRGDTVAMLMSNQPDFLCVWFGLSKLGCAVAFLNTNIKSKSLLHCFNSCGAKILVVGEDLLDTLKDVLPNLQEDNISVWAMKQEVSYTGVHCLSDKLEQVSSEPMPAKLRVPTSIKDTTLYIFTSGTTGLPKAAVVTHLQSLKGSSGFYIYGGTAEDVIYTPLPLYHSAASLIGIGGTIELGATCVLKKKFSASQFWNDCRKHNVTIFQYIGELCRYLCNQPKTENEKNHKVHMAVGNGLRQDIWKQFHSRFGKIRMCELYGSTEGNLCFMNYIGKIGAVGRSSFFYKLLFKYDLVKYDMMKDEPVRDEHGFCQKVNKGEIGLLLSRINSQSPFFGYAGSKQLTEKKLIRDVFKKGDIYFNTGDLMAEDQENFISFKDRVGDTFRWKGENVATTEVAEVLGLLEFIQEVNVYGVEVPDHEGRAGMAAFIIKPDYMFDGTKMFENAMTHLPAYARPLFVRIKESMEMTGTFKQLKFCLVKSGFNPAVISDPLYYLDYTEKCYLPLTDSVYNSIVTGHRKL